MTVAEIHAALIPTEPQDQADELLLRALNACRNSIDTGEDGLHDALGAGPWALRSVRVGGFRGAANGSGLPHALRDPLHLDFPRSAEVIVVHAPNGTGKSTVTDALEVALFGGTANCSSFNSDDLRQPIAVHAEATRAESVVVLENDQGDCLQLAWHSVDGVEHAEVTWRSLGDPHGTTERPGANWVETVAANHPVVGYDHLTHRLRAGHLTDFVHDTLSLGSTWWKIWGLLRAEHTSATSALGQWSQVRQEVVTALVELDEDLVDQHPDVRRPEPLALPESPTEDVAAWFASTFGDEQRTLLALNVDLQLTNDITRARTEATISVDRYRQARENSDQALWSGEGLAALRELVKHTAGHEAGRCPVCGEATPRWRGRAETTLRDLRVVREEFNLAQADLTELADLLVERLLPLLRGADVVPAAAEVALRLRNLIEPLSGHRPRSDQDIAWRALAVVLQDEAFDRDLRQVLSALGIASDVLEHWRAARRERCTPLVAAHSEHGADAARVEGWQAALERVAVAFDGVHGDRRDAIEIEVNRPLGALLADVDFGGIALEVGASAGDRLNETTTLRLSMDGRDTGMGTLSAGQYNALVLALLLGADTAGPFRFLVLDDPVHAFDDFRTDVFAELVARRAATGRQVVLFTHDQQLVEVMRHHVPGLCLIKLGRDAHGNIVQVDASHPWQPLITDARTVLRSNAGSGDEHRVLSATTAGLLVLAFCRQALDAALREFVLETSRGTSLGVKAALARLDRAFVTKEALRAVRGLTAQGHPARELIDAVLGENGYLDDLNAGSHGNPIGLVVAPAHLTGRIDRTERFCSELMKTVGQ